MSHFVLNIFSGITKTFILITDGPFDMGRFMYLQCKYSEISYPEYGMYWANLRKLFVNFYKASFYSNNNHAAQLPGLQTMLSRLGMEFEGQPHSGLDDAKNIARIGKLFQFHEIFQKKKNNL